jgi:hypothetical protein
MVASGSRYEQAERHAAVSHSYSERGYPLLQGEISRTSLQIRTDLRQALYLLRTEVDPLGETVSYYAKELENFPFLGHKILDDPKRWHELADMNPHVWHPLDLMPGEFLRIPVT